MQVSLFVEAAVKKVIVEDFWGSERNFKVIKQGE